MFTLIATVVLPLAIILAQLAAGVTGAIGYSAYKIAFLLLPLIYCRLHGISVRRDVLKLQNWRRGLKWTLALGLLAILIFWGAYFALGDLLLDRSKIVAKIGTQFSVNSRTVFVIAPITIVLNSLLEEFFYRGFAFGLLVQRNRAVGYVLPAVVFTVQHVLFIYDWMGWVPFAMAVAGLFVFAVVLERMYAETETLVAPWIIHVFGDVAMMGIAVTMLFAP